METLNFWNLFPLRFIKITLLFCIIFIAQLGHSQLNNHHDFRKFNLGFNMGLNFSDVIFKYGSLQNNPNKPGLKDITAKSTPGINLGLITNFKIAEFWDFRFVPQISLQQRNFTYVIDKDSSQKRRLEASYVDLPIWIKFKSELWQNHRVYVAAGVKYSINLSSDKKVRNDPDLLKIEKTDYSLICSFGIDIYGDKIKLTPEITYSYGLRNIYVPENTSYSNNITRINTQMLLISLNFE